MDVCPVSCIDFVSWDDLVALEMERLNTSVDQTFNWVKTDGNLLFSADVNAKANKNFQRKVNNLNINWDNAMENGQDMS